MPTNRRNRHLLALLIAAVVLTGAVILAPPGGLRSAAADSFTVTSTANSGPGTLRQAIADAAATPGLDDIQLAPATTYTICGPLEVPASAGTILIEGAPDRSSAITTSCPGGANGNLFTVGAGTTLKLHGATLHGGRSDRGGAIESLGSVDLTDVTVRDNEATGAGGQGGGIYADGAVFLNDVDMRDNLAGTGGAIRTTGTATVNDSVIRNNEAHASAALQAATAVIRDSAVEVNVTTGSDARAVLQAASVTLERSSMVGNAAGTGGGALSVILYATSSLDIVSSTIAHNTGGFATVVADVIDARYTTIARNAGVELQVNTSGTAFASVIGGRAEDGGSGQCSVAVGFSSSGYSVSDDTGCHVGTATGDQAPVADLGLMGPANNGGRGRSLHPTGDGPLIDRIPSGFCGGGDIRDQRKVDRPQAGSGPDARCDVGAIEYATDRTPGSPFQDVPPWIGPAVDWMWFFEIAEGFADGTYGPDQSLSRAQFVRMLYRLADEPDVANGPQHGFVDVPAWIEFAVRWAAEDPDGDGPQEPVMSGFGDRFRPGDTITRAQATRALFRAAGQPGGSPPQAFTDVPAWVEDAVGWIIEDPDGAGPLDPIATGFADDTYRPADLITRGQVARMLFRFNRAVF